VKIFLVHTDITVFTKYVIDLSQIITKLIIKIILLPMMYLRIYVIMTVRAMARTTVTMINDKNVQMNFF
jgi:hypothetical protein